MRSLEKKLKRNERLIAVNEDLIRTQDELVQGLKEQLKCHPGPSKEHEKEIVPLRRSKRLKMKVST